MSQIVVCAGGTGGHVFPALTLCDGINQCGCKSLLFTDIRGQRFCKNTDIQFQVIPQIFNNKKLFLKSFCNAFRTFIALILSWRKQKPSAVISFGGSMTVVPLLVARLMKIPAIIHEQNFVMGRANRLLAALGCHVTSNFPIRVKGAIKTATPVRAEIQKCAATTYEPLRNGKLVISVMGGSQGASVFSKILPQALEILSPDKRKLISIVQQVGKDEIDDLSKRYERLGIQAELLQFIDDVASVLVNSSLLICRGGASTLSELATIGRPAIIIPYPHATDDHQTKNAEFFDNLGAIWMINEKAFTARELASRLEAFLYSTDQLVLASINMLKSRKPTANTELTSYVMSQIHGGKI